MAFQQQVFVRPRIQITAISSQHYFSRCALSRCRRILKMSQHSDSNAKVSKLEDTGLKIITRQTQPIQGQKTGTSGLRRKSIDLVLNPNFLPNWIQALFNALGGTESLEKQTLIVGGDGRFYNKVAAQTIIQAAAANGIRKVVIGRDGLLSTPAVSAIIPRRNAIGGIIMTASHNPAGVDGDWGIKYNTALGAPAQEALTDKIYHETTIISEYRLVDFGDDVDISVVGTTVFANGKFVVEVIDPVDEYASVLRSVFDFNALRNFISRPDFKLLFDAMHAVTGEYARKILVRELGADPSSVINSSPLEDFGGGHPDPNLTYASSLVEALIPGNEEKEMPCFGAASDGDGDRNMILGSGIFVNPADSVAIIADHAMNVIPFFKNQGIVGVARSMPTASALDRVAQAKGFRIHETPTGWKYFTSLMDAGQLSICGEESFGTGSSHIREKDGLWAVLAWISILEFHNRNTAVGSLITVKDIVTEHWKTYGRTYAMRYDYENVSAKSANDVIQHLKIFASNIEELPENVQKVDEYSYEDPIDGTVVSQQGIRVFLKDGSRIVYRLSGTGSTGATIRIYFEAYEPPAKNFVVREPPTVFRELAQYALKLAQITEFTGRTAPTVIT